MKALVTLLVVGAIVYGIYAAFVAVAEYMEVASVVEESVTKALPALGRGGPGAFGRMEREERFSKVRSAIVKGSQEAGVRLGEEAVELAEEEGSLRVRVRWPYPVIRFRGEDRFVVPISLSRSYGLGPGGAPAR
ncbi:MAG: hypothetical protein HY727_03150 [Candidatus Rokubacteria bacterium]|nr:hypothetical protein [Candidatus Rokubacteria bacterium]